MSTPTAWRYQKNTSDFGIQIPYLLVANASDAVNAHHVATNFDTLSKELGIRCIRTAKFYYPRDAKVRTPTGKILRTTDAEDQVKQLALERLWKRESQIKTGSAATATKHPSFHRAGQGIGISQRHYWCAGEGFAPSASNYYANADNVAKSSIAATIKPVRSYWEGGNVITASNSSGKIKVLVGADSTTITHQILRSGKFFHKPNPSDPSTHYIDECVNNEFNDTVSNLYRNNQVAIEAKRLAPNLPDEQLLAVAQEMNAMGLIKDFDPKETAKIRGITEEYLGQREFVKKTLWSTEFEIPAEDIVEIPQAAYHLDTFIKPGPRGSLFVQDFGKTVELLESILQKGLSSQDEKIGKSYLAEAKRLQEELQPIYDKVNSTLKDAGFTLIPTPGAFYGEEKGTRVDLNFINAVSGWSDKKKSYYYICLGAKVGNELGKVLMESYREFLQTHGVPIEVHFVGYDPSKPADFSEAMSFSAKGTSQAGVHCLTYELVAEEHQ